MRTITYRELIPAVLPPEFAAKVEANVEPEIFDSEVSELTTRMLFLHPMLGAASAITELFVWCETPEGVAYWYAVRVTCFTMASMYISEEDLKLAYEEICATSVDELTFMIGAATEAGVMPQPRPADLESPTEVTSEADPTDEVPFMVKKKSGH